MEYPIIDRRDKEKIMEQIRALTPYYVPEWNFDPNGNGLGDTLVRVFAEMYGDTISQVNKLPYKSYVNFLNFMGLKLLPGLSAKGYVTVTLNEGVQPGVYIKKGTQLYLDKGDPVGQVLYETQHDVFAVDNEISHIYCVNTLRNRIVKPYGQNHSAGEVRLYDFDTYENLQKHVLYLAANEVLNVKQGALVEVEVKNPARQFQESGLAAILADQSLFTWSALTEAGWQNIAEVRNGGNRVLLAIRDPIPLLPLGDQEGRWLKCELVKSDYIPEMPVESLGIAAKADALEPEVLAANDLELASSNLLPFGENFSIYDEFYLGSEEILTKKGALITLSFRLFFKQFLPPMGIDEVDEEWKLIMNQRQLEKAEPREITIEEVVWEYWNGNGWARLLFDEKLQRIFKPVDEDGRPVVISFICPEDAEANYLNAYYNYWIRARITKLNNAYRQNAVYVSPIIDRITLAYDYRGETRKLDKILVERDLVTERIAFRENKEQLLFGGSLQHEVAAYFGLAKPLVGGPITLYLVVSKGQTKGTLPLRWEYLALENNRQKWLPLKVSDETKLLTQSGLITLLGKDNFAKGELFGEQGYWLRIIYKDQLGHQEIPHNPPRIKGFHFNTAKVRQLETYPPEYFSIEPHQAGKACQLVGENLVSLEVWVDEKATLSDQELRGLQEAKYRMEYERDEGGNIQRLWVNWKQIEDMVLAKPGERCFMADVNRGRVIFGDQRHGRIPPGGAGETIKIIYKTGRGEHGNAEVGTLNAFADAVPYVNKVFNVEPILGGCSQETLQQAIERGSQLIKHQNAAVSPEDYQQLVKQSDPNIVRVKCLAHLNFAGLKEPGAVTVAILPKFYNSHYSYFSDIRENVAQKIKEVAPCVVVYSQKLYIVEVSYLEISVDLKLVIADYNDYQPVMQQVEERLRTFMNPITGNYDGRGWEIGRYPNREKLYNIVKLEERIIRLDAINLSAQLINQQGKQPVDLDTIELNPLCVPVSGVINIELEVETGY